VLPVETDEGEREDLNGDDDREVPDPETDVRGGQESRRPRDRDLRPKEINAVESDERDRRVAAERCQSERRVCPLRRDPPAGAGGSCDRRGGRRGGGGVQRAVRGQAGLR
jgi:hypothetical protein